MEGNTVLHQLMAARMENVMNGIMKNDAFFLLGNKAEDWGISR